MKIKRAWQSLRYASMFSSMARGNYVKKQGIFGSVGKDVRLPAGLILLKTKNICLHNNVVTASGVRFAPHDAIHKVFNRIERHEGRYSEYIGRIEAVDNVFIGANAIILGPVNIGSNAIIAAGGSGE